MNTRTNGLGGESQGHDVMPFVTGGEEGLASWEIAYAQELALSHAAHAGGSTSGRGVLWLLALLVCVVVAVQGALTPVDTSLDLAKGAAGDGAASGVASVAVGGASVDAAEQSDAR